MASHRSGVSIIELVVVVAIAGILLAIGFVRFNFGGQATSQAAQVVAAAVNRARFEAVRTGATAGIEFVAGVGNSGTITICRDVDETVALACSTGTVAEVTDFSGSDLGRAVIASPASLGVYFDRRGIVRNPTSTGNTIVITDRSGGNARTVTILPTGRAEVN